MKSESVTIQIKAINYFMWCCLVCKMVLNFESVNEIQQSEHSNKSFSAFFSRGGI